MGQREEDEVGVALADEIPGECLDRRQNLARAERQVRVQLLERHGALAAVVGNAAEEERGSAPEAWVREQQACQLAARVAAHTGDGGADRVSQ